MSQQQENIFYFFCVKLLHTFIFFGIFTPSDGQELINTSASLFYWLKLLLLQLLRLQGSEFITNFLYSSEMVDSLEATYA